MKKLYKIIIIVVIACIVGFAFWVFDSIYGNPISGYIAKRAAENYLEQRYPQNDYLTDRAVFNFKFDIYGVKVHSKSSKDSYFTVYVNKLGKVTSDSYSDVTSGRNTYDRINDEYSDKVKEIFTNPDFNLNTSYAFGTIITSEETANGLNVASLELDGKYEVVEMAKTFGRLLVFAHDENVSIDKAAEMLLYINILFDDAGLPFYDIDFTLCRPFTDSESKSDENRININGLLYSDIHENGYLQEKLIKNLEEAHVIDEGGK